jgi:hypothetical protein
MSTSKSQNKNDIKRIKGAEMEKEKVKHMPV